MKTNINFWQYLAHFFLEWEMFQIKFVQKIQTQILFIFRKSHRSWDNVGKYKYCRDGQATYDNMAQAHYTLYT